LRFGKVASVKTNAVQILLDGTPEPAPAKPRKGSKGYLLWELGEFRKANHAHGCLLTQQQAALILDISHQRVRELLTQGKLTSFEFFGRTYCSEKEITARRNADLSAGTKRRGVHQRLKLAAKVVAAHDRHTALHDLIS
jgi:hypothetical protein